MKASEEGFEEILELLVTSGASLEAANLKGRTALGFAAAPSMKRPTPIGTLKHLLLNRADPTKNDNKGVSPFEHAKKEHRQEAVELMKPFVQDWIVNDGEDSKHGLDMELNEYIKRG